MKNYNLEYLLRGRNPNNFEMPLKRIQKLNSED